MSRTDVAVPKSLIPNGAVKGNFCMQEIKIDNAATRRKEVIGKLTG